MLRNKFITTLLLLFLVSPIFAQEIIFQASDFEIIPNKQKSITSKLAKALSLIKAEQIRSKKPAKLVFLKGKYYFDAVDSPHKELYISNHDQVGQRSIGMLIDGMKDLTIEGMNSKFICRGRMLPIAVLNSQNIKINHLSVDFENPQIAQIEVLESSNKGLVFRPSKEVKWRINKDGYFETFGQDWKLLPSTGIAFEKGSKRMAYRIADLTYSTQGTKVLENGVLLAPQWRDSRLKANMIIAMRTYERPSPAFFLANNEDTYINNVNVHYAEGMGLLAQACQNITLNSFNVCLDKTAQRYFTTQADATHFSGCSGQIDVHNSLFEGMMDDAINVHGVYLKLIKRLNANQLVGRYMHPQAWGFEWGVKGEKVQFIESSTFDKLGSLYTIKDIKPYRQNKLAGAKEFVITFKERLPKLIDSHKAIGIENLSRTPAVNFTHNLIQHNRARGTLFNTPKKVLVESNVFNHVSGSAILVSTDCNMWFESGQTKELIIRNNQFIDVLTSLYQFTEAVISIYPIIPNLNEQRRPFYGNGKGIVIEDNIFQTFDTPLLFAISTNGILWRKNTILPTNTYSKHHHNQERYKFKKCKNILFEED